MALPALGAISMADYNTELQNPAGTQLSMNQSSFRNLAGVPSADTTISMTSGYGKSNTFYFSFSGDRVNLYIAATNAGWNGTAKVVATMSGNVYSASAGSAALYVSGFPQNVYIDLNTYYIVGGGGNGGAGSGTSGVAGTAGGAGGIGLVVTSTNLGGVNVNNSGSIIGGAGGGGGGGYYVAAVKGAVNASGGGGGGGAAYGSGAAGGSGAASGGGATLTLGGAGGAGGTSAGAGGAGGSLGASGGAGGSSSYAGGSGGSAGAAVSGNAYVTWSGAGSFMGARN